MANVRNLWRLPVFPDSETSEKARTLHALLLAGIAIISVALGLSIWRRSAMWTANFDYAAMLVGHAAALLLLGRGFLRVAVATHAVLYLSVITFAMYQYGGIRSPAGFLLPPIVLLVGLTWSGKVAIFTASLASLMALGLVVLERHGLLPTATTPDPVAMWIVATATLVITAVVLKIALANMERSRGELARTERTRRGLEERLLRSRRLELVARLAAGVAHDFNNTLSAIALRADILDRSEDPAASAAACEISETARRGAALTRQLLAVGRSQVLNPTLLDANQVIRELERLLRSLGRGTPLVMELGECPGKIRADRTQLEQVLMNLVGNAFDATSTGGVVTIRTGAATPEQLARSQPWLATGYGVVCMSVVDTGAGMDANTMARIFEPFFTTKPDGEGTGLGLATVHGIVEQSGGDIFVESEPGRGSSFHVLMPAAATVTPAG